MNSIFSRRSIREYLDKSVEEEKIQQLLKAGMAGPSAHNQKPWHFIIVDAREKLDAIAEHHPYAKMLKSASLAIVVCKTEEGIKSPDLWAQDCSAATQNILLMAETLEIGSCWIGVYPKEERMQEVRDALHLPEDITPFSVISLGYKAEEKGPNERILEDRIHRNEW